MESKRIWIVYGDELVSAIATRLDVTSEGQAEFMADILDQEIGTPAARNVVLSIPAFSSCAKAHGAWSGKAARIAHEKLERCWDKFPDGCVMDVGWLIGESQHQVTLAELLAAIR